MAGAGGNTIGGCASAVTAQAIPALGLGEMAILVTLLAGAGLFVMRRLSV
jgi:hypothetical protein